MDAGRSTVAVVDPRFRDHRGPATHPEHPDRLAAVEAALDARGDGVGRRAPRPATPDEILRIHSREHAETIAAAAARAPMQLDPDTYASAASAEVALLAAGGCVDLVRDVATGRLGTGLAAVRPPGHHAEAGHAMGFCLFNNVAIAARAVQASEGVGRILILDWDVHHGNGTQHSFEEDPSVLYLSTHQFPYYPGTGDVSEAGRGPGLGATVNVPLPAGSRDEEYEGVFARVVVPVATTFRPELILVSCGFDAHRDDPLAAMSVSADGFRSMADTVLALADDLCDGRVAFVLEGGYSATGLFEGTAAVLDAWRGAPAARRAPPPLRPEGAVARVLGRLAQVHAGRFPGLGAA